MQPYLITLAMLLAQNDPDWPKFLEQQNKAYEVWQQDNESGNLEQFITSKVVSARNPKTEQELKTLVFWLAMYAEKKQTPPDAVSAALKDYEATFKTMLPTIKQIFEKIKENK